MYFTLKKKCSANIGPIFFKESRPTTTDTKDSPESD